MKIISLFFENGFVFDFLKMDKNKCPKNFCKNRLTDKKIYYDILFLSSQIKPFLYFFVMIFFEKKVKDIFFRKYNGKRGNQFYAKKRQIFL
jgi:hypothetical protein